MASAEIPGLEIRLTSQGELDITLVDEVKFLIHMLGENWDQFTVKERLAILHELETRANGEHPLQEQTDSPMHSATDDASTEHQRRADRFLGQRWDH